MILNRVEIIKPGRDKMRYFVSMSKRTLFNSVFLTFEAFLLTGY